MDIHDAQTIMWLGLAFLFAVGGAGLAYALWRTGRLLRGMERDITRTVDEVVPVIVKTGVSMDTVNVQLEKLDVMMDSAVDMTGSLDTAVRAVSIAIVEPVKKVSGVFAGAGEAATSFRERMSESAARDTATADSAPAAPAPSQDAAADVPATPEPAGGATS